MRTSRGRWIVLFLLALVLAGALAVPLLLNLERHRGAAEAWLSRQLEREVSIGSLGLTLRPLAIDARDLRIAEDPAFADAEFTHVETLRLHLSGRPLLRGELRVTSFDVLSPTIRLVQDERGVWNVASLGRPRAPDEPRVAPWPAALGAVAIGTFSLSDGRVAIVRHDDPPAEHAYVIRSFRAEQVATGRMVPFRLVASPADRDEPVEIEGEAGPLDPGNLADLSAWGQFKADALLMGGARATDVEGRFETVGRTIEIEPLHFAFYAGRHEGRVSVDLGERPGLTIGSRLRDVDLEPLLADIASVHDWLHAPLTADVRLQSRAARGEFLDRLTGSADVALGRGELRRVAVGPRIAEVARLTGVALPSDHTPITEATGRFQIGDRSARTGDLRIVMPDLELLCEGSIGFDGELAFDVLAAFSPEASQRIRSATPAARVVETMLVDDKGRVAVPLRLAGTIQDPQLAPDTRRLTSLREDLLDRGRETILDLLKRRLERPIPR